MASQYTHNYEKPWFLTVEMLPEHLKDWGVFKDLIRSYLPSNQPGWTTVDYAGNGFYVGTFSVKTESDSKVVYERLVGYNDKDTRLLVHRFDTSGYQTSLLECNCQALYNVAHMAKSRSYSEVNRSMAMPPQQPSYVYPSVPVAATPVVSTYDWSQTGASIQGVTSGFQGLSVGQAVYPAPYYAASAGPSYTQQYYQAGPEYAINTYGLPVNVSHGTVSTECREVHISNIPHRIKKRDLVAQISKIATPTKVQLHSDHAGKFKGTAVATFGRGDEAARVVEHLDKLPFKGKELRVRIGKEQTPVNPGPLVVNGSTGYSNT